MGQLTNLYVSQSYQGLLKLTDSTTGLTTSLQTIQDGLGGNSPLQMSTTQVNISGSFFINNVPITNGTNGTSGTSGVNGSSGTSGQSGSSGSTGSGGTSGTSGTSGGTGSSGTSGSNGSSGTSGVGTSGTSGTSGQAGSSGTSGNDGSSGTSGINGSSGTSGTSGINGSSGTSGDTGSAGTSGTSGTSPSGGDRNGLITTGSIVDTQQITGSLILGNTVISGSLIGNTVNDGIIKIQSEGNISGSVKFNITSSSPISQSNVIFGGTVGPAAANLTGSVTISGSNNILFNGFRTNTLLTAGTYGYLNGFGNIGSTIPTLGTGSVIRPTINNNALQSGLSLQFTTSSLTLPNIGNNLIYGTTTLNHQSGSVVFTSNGMIGGFVTSTQNITTPNTQASITNNLFTSNLTTTLSHNSSSIIYQGNIGAVTVTNNYSSSVSTAVDNIDVTRNLFNGASISLVVTGSNTSNRRTFNSNLVSGRSNLVNSDHSGSSAGHLVSTAILGEQLIVSASHTNQFVGGTVFVGRFNATGSLQESSQDAIFVVGTGGGNSSRRNAIHVDSSNNTRITGSVLITGSLSVNGVTPLLGTTGLITTGSFGNSQTISGSLLLQANPAAGQAPGLVIQTWNNTAPAANITGSVGVSGSLNVSGSVNVSNGNVNIISSSLNLQATSLYINQDIVFNGSNQFTGPVPTYVSLAQRTPEIWSFGNAVTNSPSSGSNLYISNNNSNQAGLSFDASWANTTTNLTISNTNGLRNIIINSDTTVISSSLSVTGSVNITGSLSVNGVTPLLGTTGLITTGSNADGEQYITGGLYISSSGNFNKVALTVSSGPNEGKIGVEGGAFLYRNSSTRNTVVGEVQGVSVNTPFTSGSQNNLLFTGFNLGFTSGSNNSIIAGAGGSFLSGSNNTILGSIGNLQYGNGNLIIGGGRTSTLMENVISIGNNNSPDLIYKSGSVVQMGYSTQVTGSLNATTLSSATGYQDITGTLTASLNLSQANVWFIDDDDDPSGAHLDVTNLTDGQQISIIWNANYSGTRTITLGSNIEKTGSTTGSFTLEGAKKYQIMGAVYGGKLYITPLL